MDSDDGRWEEWSARRDAAGAECAAGLDASMQEVPDESVRQAIMLMDTGHEAGARYTQNPESQETDGSVLSKAEVLDLFRDYLDLRRQEGRFRFPMSQRRRLPQSLGKACTVHGILRRVAGDPFVSPAIPHAAHPYTAEVRLDVISWMHQVAEEIFASSFPLHLAIHVLDAVAPYVSSTKLVPSNRKVPGDFLQLIAACSLNVMQKLHADYCALFNQIGKVCAEDSGFSLQQCMYMEMVILKIADLSFQRASVMSFSRIFCRLCVPSARTRWLISYLSDLLLIYGRDLRRGRFSMYAVVIYVLSVASVNQRESLSVEPWPLALARFTRMDFVGQANGFLTELLYDIHRLQESHSGFDQRQQKSAFFRKYRSAACVGTASSQPLSAQSLRKLVQSLEEQALARQHIVLSERNDSENVVIRAEPRGPSPFLAEETSAGRYRTRVRSESNDVQEAKRFREDEDPHSLW